MYFFSDFRRLLIKVVLLLAISSQAYSVVIDCIFSSYYGPNTCIVRSVQNQEISEVTQIIGNHNDGHSHEDIENFFSNDEEFLTFPKGLDKFFPNLKAIRIDNSTLTSITSADLAPWPNLTFFSVDENYITTLDGDLFKNSLKLESINFKYNAIRHVGLNLLSNLNELQSVDFRNNPCIDMMNSISQLKTQLIKQCPPLSKPKETIAADQLKALLELHSQKLENLEKDFKEFAARPCSCNSI